MRVYACWREFVCACVCVCVEGTLVICGPLGLFIHLFRSGCVDAFTQARNLLLLLSESDGEAAAGASRRDQVSVIFGEAAAGACVNVTFGVCSATKTNKHQAFLILTLPLTSLFLSLSLSVFVFLLFPFVTCCQ